MSTPVFVAQVPDGILAERERLISQLQRRGVNAGPIAVYSPGARDFAALVADGMAGAGVFVQLLDAEADDFAALQLAMAEARGMKVVQWMPLRVESGDQHPLARNGALAKVSLDRLAELVATEALGTQPAPQRLVFVNFAPVDAMLGHTLQNELVKRGFVVTMPPLANSPTALHASLIDYFQSCDALVIAFHNADAIWIRAQLKLFIKARPGRVVPVVIYSIDGAADLRGAIPGAKQVHAQRIALDGGDGLTATSLDQMASVLAS